MLLARRAKDANNFADAAKYYNMAQLEDPFNWEAAFYNVYCTAIQTNIAGISSAGNLVTDSLPTIVGLIKKHTPEDQQLTAAISLSSSCTNLGKTLYHAAADHYNSIDLSIRHNYVGELRNRGTAAVNVIFILGTTLEHYFGRNEAYEDLISNAFCTAHIMMSKDAVVFPGGAPQRLIDYRCKYDHSFMVENAKQQIANMKSRINYLSETTTVESNKGCAATVAYVSGGVLLLCGFIVALSVYFGAGIPLLIIGAICILIGNVLGKPKEKSEIKLESDQREIARLEDEIAKLEDQAGLPRSRRTTPSSGKQSSDGAWWICDNCSSSNNPSKTHCSKCGADRPNKISTPSQPKQTPPSTPAADTWTCSKCGTSNKTSYGSCKKCGTYRSG